MKGGILVVAIVLGSGLWAAWAPDYGGSVARVASVDQPAPATSHQETRKSEADETSAADLEGIEKLNQQDIKATLSGDVQQLADLWDADGVLMAPGAPSLVGRKAIQTELERDKQENPETKTVGYVPHVEDKQLTNGWAFEWGYFDAQSQDSPQKKPSAFRARFLRVLKREPDGSWKFSRVMWNLPAKSH